MSNWRKLANRSTILLCGLLIVLCSAAVARSQSRGYPGPAAREGNRSMDEYDRTINRMKNDAKAANERRRNLFPQINEDFQRIQVIHNEIVRMLQPDKGFNYDRLADLSGDMKKRGERLRENLALTEPDNTDAQPAHPEAIDEAHIKKTIADLHELIVSFVANPLFKNLGVVDANVVNAATENLENIIDISDEIKREAKLLEMRRDWTSTDPTLLAYLSTVQPWPANDHEPGRTRPRFCSCGCPRGGSTCRWRRWSDPPPCRASHRRRRSSRRRNRHR